MTSPRFRALPGEHRKVYSNRSEADFVMPSGIITSYLKLRLVVGSGFLDNYPGRYNVFRLNIPLRASLARRSRQGFVHER